MQVGQRVSWTKDGNPGDGFTMAGRWFIGGETYTGIVSRLWEPVQERDEDDRPYMTAPAATVDFDGGGQLVIDIAELVAD